MARLRERQGVRVERRPNLWWKLHPEEAREAQRRYRKNHPERVAERQRRYRQEHAEQIALRIRRYQQKPEVKARRAALQRPRNYLRRAPGPLIDPLAIFVRDGGLCGICGEVVSATDFHLDRIPLARGGSHSHENIQVAHPVCNLRKGSRLNYDGQQSVSTKEAPSGR